MIVTDKGECGCFPASTHRPPAWVFDMVAERKLGGLTHAMSTRGTRKGTKCAKCNMVAIEGACYC